MEAENAAKVRSFIVGYRSKYAFAVAKGLSTGLLVQINLDAISFSH
jgi:hypothetical protein